MIVRFFNYLEKQKMLELAFRYLKVNTLIGDYMEFGVFRGTTFIRAYYVAKKKKVNAHFYAFDSFEGLPECSEGKFFSKNMYSYSKEKFENRLKRNGVNLDDVTITKGWFNKDMTKGINSKASIILIDCDLYKSTVPVLESITDKIQNGTLIIFDDWYFFGTDGGERKAFNEWLKKNPSITAKEFYRFGWGGKAFVLYIK